MGLVLYVKNPVCRQAWDGKHAQPNRNVFQGLLLVRVYKELGGASVLLNLKSCLTNARETKNSKKYLSEDVIQFRRR